MSRIELDGQKFGNLTVVVFSHYGPRWHAYWRCLCTCGNEKIVASAGLRRGTSQSCGCVHGVAISNPVTHEQLKALLHYDPQLGNFTWRVDGGRGAVKGSFVGHIGERGYVRVGLGNRYYRAHVLAWFYMTGEWPKSRIDHRDLNPTNNRWENIRLATHSQNMSNARVRKSNRTGFKGVSPKGRMFQARIAANGVYHHVGTFLTAELAARAYDAAALLHHGEFARLNFGAE